MTRDTYNKLYNCKSLNNTYTIFLVSLHKTTTGFESFIFQCVDRKNKLKSNLINI
jgi:hypothetical protein